MDNISKIVRREYQDIFPCRSFSSQWWAYIAIVIIWTPAMLSPFVGGVRAFFGDAIKEIFLLLAYIIPLTCGFKYIIYKLAPAEVVFYLCCIVVYIFNYILFPANTVYLEQNLTTTFFQVFPLIFVGSFMQKEKLWKLLFYCSCFSVLWNYYYYAHVVVAAGYGGTSEFVNENMTKSYANLSHVLMVLWLTFRKPKIWKIVISALGVLMVLGFGTRGPLACTGVFIATYLFIFRTYKHAILFRGIIVVCLLLFFVYIDHIFEFLGGYVEQLGLSTRIFDYFTGSGLDDANGRDMIKIQLSRYLEVVPFWGYGIWGTYLLIGGYPHDLIWDMIFTFGYIGVFLLIILVIIVFVAIKKTIDSIQKEFICVLICGPAVLKLMMSGSFLAEPYFFLFLGYCISIISQSTTSPNQYTNSK